MEVTTFFSQLKCHTNIFPRNNILQIGFLQKIIFLVRRDLSRFINRLLKRNWHNRGTTRNDTELNIRFLLTDYLIVKKCECGLGYSYHFPSFIRA